MEEIKYVFAIYSCKKYLETAISTYNMFLKNALPNFVKIYIVYGDKEINSDFLIKDHLFLVLNVEDTYDKLTEKSIQLFRTVIRIHPNLKGCFKCDDDIIPNKNELIKIIDNIYEDNDYIGKIVISKKYSEHHINKGIASKIVDDVIENPVIRYCAGPLYYLSNKSMNILLKQEVDIFLYEDLTIGYHLQKYNVFPFHYEYMYIDDRFQYMNKHIIHNSKRQKIAYFQLSGGLGNQMFQIASAYGITIPYNVQPIFILYGCVNTHNNNNDEYYDTILKRVQTINENFNINFEKKFIEPNDKCFSYIDNISDPTNIYFNGYYQNERYFKKYKKDIYKIFKIIYLIRNVRDSFENLDNSYFIHVRRGDYVNNRFHYIDLDSYYERAIEHIKQYDRNAHFYILSDDIDYCKKYKIFDNINKTFVDPSIGDVDSLYLISLCRKGGICCNSTFSWWGSYLNDNPEKIVIFPNKWFNGDYPVDIYYEGSTILDV
jgi:hypothetical protein